MKSEDFNKLPLNERADLLWGPGGKGTLCESSAECGKYKKIDIYLLDNILVSVYYCMQTNEIVDIKAWGRSVEKARMLENVSDY
jgi:hypothetical protein